MTEELGPAERAAPAIARVVAEGIARHEARHHSRDLPKSIPPYLWPQGTEQGWPDSTGEDALVMVATAEEWLTIARLVATLKPPPGGNVRTLWRDGSPWLEVAVVTGVAPPRVERFAIWRYSLAVHRVRDTGAVEDDPMELVG